LIFVTVGTQLAFDRLITAVDAWVGAAPDHEVFAQIGPSKLQPRHIDHAQFVAPEECAERIRGARAIVAHAGMGTILTALELGKPLLVMPRRAKLGEHRNDHQLATARRFAQQGRVKVAFDETELPALLDDLDRLAGQPPIGPYAPTEFIDGIRAFIADSLAAQPGEAAAHPGVAAYPRMSKKPFAPRVAR
jgi:UDP-N-acetylglucosamine transferase subunit ALG13